VRAVLWKAAGDDHVLDLIVSHLAFDAWSRDVFRDELTALYDAFAKGEPSPLAEPSVQYVDFAAWERRLYQGDYLRESIEYWNSRLPDFSIWRSPLNVADLSFHRRAAAPTGRIGIADISFDAAALDRMLALARRENVTMFMLMYAAFCVVLRRHVARTRITLWTGFANRTRPEIQSAIGWYATAHLLSLTIDGDPRFVDVLRQARDVVRGALAHQGMPLHFLAMKQGLDIPSGGFTPIPQAAIGLAEVAAGAPPSEGRGPTRLVDEPIGGAGWGHDQWLQFNIRGFQRPDGLKIALDYPADWFDAKPIRGLLAEVQTLLHDVLTSPDARLTELATARS
jgi:hypothetical protein